MKKNLVFSFIFLAGTAIIFSGCKRGEEDPWLTFHSRDARMSQPWKLVSMTGTVVTTVDGNETNIEYEFDGTNIYISQGSETESFVYVYKMDVKDNGEVFSEELQTNINNGDIITQSSKTSFWYWGNDDKNKTSVNLDLTGILSDYLSYDIPRLAWNDMTLMVDYSDNSTIFNEADTSYTAASESVLFELKFEVDLDALAE